jgi:dihydrofolate reductase
VENIKTNMIIALFAVDERGGMGNQGNIPWPTVKEDMKWFKETTQGQVVVMGKKSWLSPDMPKPLPKRHNVVFTNQFMNEHPDIDQIGGDVCEGLKRVEALYPDNDIFVIGGANLLMQARPVIDRAFITRIPGEYICDTVLNLKEFLEEFAHTNSLELGTCTVELYERIS